MGAPVSNRGLAVAGGIIQPSTLETQKSVFQFFYNFLFMRVIYKNQWNCVRSLNLMISKIKRVIDFCRWDILTITIGRCSFSSFICSFYSLVVLYCMIFGFSAIGSSFDGVIAVLVSNQRSQLLEFGHQDYL